MKSKVGRMNFYFKIAILIALSVSLLTIEAEHLIYDFDNHSVHTKRHSPLESKLTIITTTSYIRSHPSTKMLEITQKSLFINSVFAVCKKIIVFDGLKPSQANDPMHQENYKKYKERVIELCRTNPYFSHTKLIFLDRNYTLALAIQEALDHVNTPYIFLHQHDLEHLKPIPVRKIIESMEKNPCLKHIRVPNEVNNPDYWDGPIDMHIEGGALVPLCRTFRWCDTEHFSSVSYYRDFVLPNCQLGGFMESCIHATSFIEGQQKILSNHALYGTYKYGYLGDGEYTRHLDGQNY